MTREHEPINCYLGVMLITGDCTYYPDHPVKCKGELCEHYHEIVKPRKALE